MHTALPVPIAALIDSARERQAAEEQQRLESRRQIFQDRQELLKSALPGLFEAIVENDNRAELTRCPTNPVLVVTAQMPGLLDFTIQINHHGYATFEAGGRTVALNLSRLAAARGPVSQPFEETGDPFADPFGDPGGMVALADFLAGLRSAWEQCNDSRRKVAAERLRSDLSAYRITTPAEARDTYREALKAHPATADMTRAAVRTWGKRHREHLKSAARQRQQEIERQKGQERDEAAVTDYREQFAIAYTAYRETLAANRERLAHLQHKLAGPVVLWRLGYSLVTTYDGDSAIDLQFAYVLSPDPDWQGWYRTLRGREVTRSRFGHVARIDEIPDWRWNRENGAILAVPQANSAIYYSPEHAVELVAEQISRLGIQPLPAFPAPPEVSRPSLLLAAERQVLASWATAHGDDEIEDVTALPGSCSTYPYRYYHTD